MKPIIAIDCETGGLDETKHALLSVGLVELDENYNPVRLKEVFIKPTLEAQEEAAKINGYSVEEWDKNAALDLPDAMGQIFRWIPGEYTPVAHNAPFDKKFMEFNGLMEQEWICTKKLYQSIAGDPCNLDAAARRVFHWPADYQRKSHGALIDALACAAVYKWCKTKEAYGIGLATEYKKILKKYDEIDAEITAMQNPFKPVKEDLVNYFDNIVQKFK